MTENIAPQNSEAESTSKIAFLFDVDGVVINPVEKKVTEEGLFELLEGQLKQGNPVTLNTGRSNEWMIERVIRPLEARILDKVILENFFAVGEKGITWISFNSHGRLIQGVFNRADQAVEGFDLSSFLDADTIVHFKTLEKEAKELIDSQYSHSTFLDTTKKAMISTEMHDGYDQPKYALEQIQFTTDLHELLKREGLEGKFKVDPTTIATDIQIPEAGKHLGAKRILQWLQRNNITPSHFIAVGDSSSDLEMADELSIQGKSVDFYYVNPKKPLTIEKPYPVHITTSEFGNGTLEVFELLKK